MKIQVPIEIKKALEEQNVKLLIKFFWDEELPPYQEKIVRTIAFATHKRNVITAMTRYGKSYSVAIGVCLYVLLNKNKRVLLIAPIDKQTSILRNYVADRIVSCKILSDMLDLDATGIDKIKKEVSKTKLTFKNDSEIMTLSAEGTGTRLMGWGGDLIVIDESCLVKSEVYRVMISRMLGDNPNSVLVEIGNPWTRDSHMYEHWKDPNFNKIHIGYDIAIKEGRVTSEFIEEQRKILTPMEFSILYFADFPQDMEDTLIKWEWIERALE